MATDIRAMSDHDTAQVQDLERRADGSALARSILGHRDFCPACRPHAEQALAALNGATIEELAEGSR